MTRPSDLSPTGVLLGLLAATLLAIALIAPARGQAAVVRCPNFHVLNNDQIGKVQLPIGYFANVIDIGGGVGLAICTDGVGSKAIVAEMMGKYDTIGIDCVAMNVNDLLCVGARPLSMVDYIATDKADAAVLDGIAIGLAEGARQSSVSISGGEI